MLKLFREEFIFWLVIMVVLNRTREVLLLTEVFFLVAAGLYSKVTFSVSQNVEHCVYSACCVVITSKQSINTKPCCLNRTISRDSRLYEHVHV